MSTAAVTPNTNGSPCDDPSLVQTTKGASNGTSFQDPALIAAISPQSPYDAAKTAAMSGIGETPSDISTGPEAGNRDQPLMSDASQKDATKKGLIIGSAGALGVGGLAAGPLVAAGMGEAPVVSAIGNHLAVLHKVVKMARQYGWGVDLGYREAAKSRGRRPLFGIVQCCHAFAGEGSGDQGGD